jgi:hypothetical protein
MRVDSGLLAAVDAAHAQLDERSRPLQLHGFFFHCRFHFKRWMNLPSTLSVGIRFVKNDGPTERLLACQSVPARLYFL